MHFNQKTTHFHFDHSPTNYVGNPALRESKRKCKPIAILFLAQIKMGNVGFLSNSLLVIAKDTVLLS
jgi:hypothetical protein